MKHKNILFAIFRTKEDSPPKEQIHNYHYYSNYYNYYYYHSNLTSAMV